MIPSICLNMIVRDESAILEKTLRNVCEKFPITYWVICDTGSQDSTMDIIGKTFESLKIPGELHQHEWIGFDHNRTLALQAAHGKSDYLLIFDADDEVCGEVDLNGWFYVPFDIYNLKLVNGDMIYYRPLLIENRKHTWKFVGVVHEFLEEAQKLPTKQTELRGNYHIKGNCSGARSLDPEKYKKDALRIEKAYAELGDDSSEDVKYLKARYAFYCGQSYHCAGGPKEKIQEWYSLCICSQGFIQERYIAALRLGEIQGDVTFLQLAMQFDPERIEAVLACCRYYQSKKMYAEMFALYVRYRHYDHNHILSRGKDKLFLQNYNNELDFYHVVSTVGIGLELFNKSTVHQSLKRVLTNEHSELQMKKYCEEISHKIDFTQ